jgi:hypothetical protein
MSVAVGRHSVPTRPRAIAYRTRGRTQGSITRLMSPSDLGEVLKPFVFLDLVDHEGPPLDARFGGTPASDISVPARCCMS